ncbi:hypothetical protein QEN19_000099 [Hanseniaspora menglaensis]
MDGRQLSDIYINTPKKHNENNLGQIYIEEKNSLNTNGNLNLKQRLMRQKDQIEHTNGYQNSQTLRSYHNKSISPISSNLASTEINNTSKKLRRFVNNRLFDVDLGKAKRSESPLKESEEKHSLYKLNDIQKTLDQSRSNIDLIQTKKFDKTIKMVKGSPIKPVKNINLKRSISALHMPPNEENNNYVNFNFNKNDHKTDQNKIVSMKADNLHLNIAEETDKRTSLNFSSILPSEKVEINGVLYKKIELIGKGGSSKVYKIKRLFKVEALETLKQQGIHTSTTFALKRVDFDYFDEGSINFFKGEINILHKLQNKNRVVKLIDYEMKVDHINLVMECGSYSLSNVLASRKELDFDVDFVKHHFKEICLCLKDVHDADIIHSDLKPDNFVFVKGILKIIDFGIADSIPENTVNIYRNKQFGTPSYMAPEALVRLNNNDTNYTGSNFVFDYNAVDNAEVFWKVGKPSDIWSLGCILHQMVYGETPYGRYEGHKRLKAIMDPRTTVKTPTADKKGNLVPKSIILLINRCLEKTSKNRPLINEILYEDEFLNSVNISKERLKNALSASLKKISKSTQRLSALEFNDEYLNKIFEDLASI